MHSLTGACDRGWGPPALSGRTARTTSRAGDVAYPPTRRAGTGGEYALPLGSVPRHKARGRNRRARVEGAEAPGLRVCEPASLRVSPLRLRPQAVGRILLDRGGDVFRGGSCAGGWARRAEACMWARMRRWGGVHGIRAPARGTANSTCLLCTSLRHAWGCVGGGGPGARVVRGCATRGAGTVR